MEATGDHDSASPHLTPSAGSHAEPVAPLGHLTFSARTRNISPGVSLTLVGFIRTWGRRQEALPGGALHRFLAFPAKAPALAPSLEERSRSLICAGKGMMSSPQRKCHQLLSSRPPGVLLQPLRVALGCGRGGRGRSGVSAPARRALGLLLDFQEETARFRGDGNGPRAEAPLSGLAKAAPLPTPCDISAQREGSVQSQGETEAPPSLVPRGPARLQVQDVAFDVHVSEGREAAAAHRWLHTKDEGCRATSKQDGVQEPREGGLPGREAMERVPLPSTAVESQEAKRHRFKNTKARPHTSSACLRARGAATRDQQGDAEDMSPGKDASVGRRAPRASG